MRHVSFTSLTLFLTLLSACSDDPSSPGFVRSPYEQFGTGVVLMSRATHGSYEQATFSFEFATRDDTDLTRNDWDLLYGNGGSADPFQVDTAGSDDNYIADLGVVEFDDIVDIPFGADFQKNATAQLGYVYILHSTDSNSELHAKFVITALSSGDRVTFDWVRSDDGSTFTVR